MNDDSVTQHAPAVALETALACVDRALAWRESDPALSGDSSRDRAFRAFNGFVEGDPSIVLEVFGTCLVVFDYGVSPEGDGPRVRAMVERVCQRWPWIETALWKIRRAEDPALRNGRLLRGERERLPETVREGSVRYAIDLLMSRDASLYLDTASLRAWLTRESTGRSVLNAFAYTGSLGVAAQAGGALRVIQVDRSGRSLSIAAKSYQANGWASPARGSLIAEDFFRAVARMKSQGRLFDTVIVDPPFFSDSAAGTVDLEADPARLLNKVRPLVAHGGRIVLVNNALWMPGRRWMDALEAACKGGYLSVRETLGVDELSRGRSADGGAPSWPTDPSPFAHPTKIAVLEAIRKDRQPANVR